MSRKSLGELLVYHKRQNYHIFQHFDNKIFHDYQRMLRNLYMQFEMYIRIHNHGEQQNNHYHTCEGVGMLI